MAHLEVRLDRVSAQKILVHLQAVGKPPWRGHGYLRRVLVGLFFWEAASLQQGGMGGCCSWARGFEHGRSAYVFDCAEARSPQHGRL